MGDSAPHLSPAGTTLEETFSSSLSVDSVGGRKKEAADGDDDVAGVQLALSF